MKQPIVRNVRRVAGQMFGEVEGRPVAYSFAFFCWQWLDRPEGGRVGGEGLENAVTEEYAVVMQGVGGVAGANTLLNDVLKED